jgi:hypothetical protein
MSDPLLDRSYVKVHKHTDSHRMFGRVASGVGVGPDIFEARPTDRDRSGGAR